MRNLRGATSPVCDAAVDGTRAFHPIAGLLQSGGNPVLGTGATLGGLGHFSLTARANAAHVVLPTRRTTVPVPPCPRATRSTRRCRCWKAPPGSTAGCRPARLIDLLASAQLLPTDQIDHLTVDQGARRIGDIALGLGYGVRVGVTRDLGPLPAISVSLMRRDIPTIAYGDLARGDQFHYAVDLHATNLRVVASKQLAASPSPPGSAGTGTPGTPRSGFATRRARRSFLRSSWA
jgi:hypothetical protein